MDSLNPYHGFPIAKYISGKWLDGRKTLSLSLSLSFGLDFNIAKNCLANVSSTFPFRFHSYSLIQTTFSFIIVESYEHHWRCNIGKLLPSIRRFLFTFLFTFFFSVSCKCKCSPKVVFAFEFNSNSHFKINYSFRDECPFKCFVFWYWSSL